MSKGICWRIYLIVVTSVLVAAALVKLATGMTDFKLGELRDPLFQLSYLTTWRLGAMFELVVVFALYMLPGYRAPIITWVGALFVLYHTFAGFVTTGPMCPCLGNLAGWLGLTQAQVAWFTRSFALWMLLGGALFWWRAAVPRARTEIDPTTASRVAA